MKHILEYEDHEIEDLLGDMESIGQAKKVKASIWIEYVAGRSSLAISKILTTDDFYTAGDAEGDAKRVLQKIADGEFEFTPTGDVSVNYPRVHVFSKENIQEMAKDYLKNFESYTRMHRQNPYTPPGGNGLDAFARDMAIKSINKYRGDMELNLRFEFKVFVAPPNSSYHESNSMYTLPNPVDVVEYDTK